MLVMAQKPVTPNACRNMGTLLKTVPVPINFLHPNVWVRFFFGYRHGWPKKTPGLPVQIPRHEWVLGYVLVGATEEGA